MKQCLPSFLISVSFVHTLNPAVDSALARHCIICLYLIALFFGDNLALLPGHKLALWHLIFLALLLRDGHTDLFLLVFTSFYT